LHFGHVQSPAFFATGLRNGTSRLQRTQALRDANTIIPQPPHGRSPPVRKDDIGKQMSHGVVARAYHGAQGRAEMERFVRAALVHCSEAGVAAVEEYTPERYRAEYAALLRATRCAFTAGSSQLVDGEGAPTGNFDVLLEHFKRTATAAAAATSGSVVRLVWSVDRQLFRSSFHFLPPVE
jgi:hypothetical protein